jgi:SecD/SecF fusion protein
MRVLLRNLAIVLGVLILSIWSIIPPEKKLRLGRDLRGGTSLVYSVQVKPGDPGDVVSRVIDVIKNRVDPNGLSEIAIVQQGRDRIEITMPLPNARVKKLKADYEAALQALAARSVDPAEFERVMRMDAAAREAEIARMAGKDEKRSQILRDAATTSDTATAARAALKQAQADLAAAKTDLASAQTAHADEARIKELDTKVKDLTTRVDDQVAATADAETARDKAREKALAQSIKSSEVRQAVEASTENRVVVDDQTGQREVFESPREQKLKDLKTRYPDEVAGIEAVIAAFDRYAAERTRLDDPADLKRMLAGAGVLDFRITVKPGQHPQESRLRRELHERGPRNVQSTDARWYKINKIDTWFDTVQQLQHLKSDPAAFFAARGYVVEFYDGDYYMLAWDTPGNRLTRSEGDWAVSAAYPSTDPQRGTPAISFEMNALGGSHLGDLTGNHVHDQMAVLLDDQVYTAPTLQSKITRSGQITGTFSDAEIRYIVRVLSAGSLQAKLSPQPISESSLGPQLGADNLKAGFTTGIMAFAIVASFMVVYYFGSGMIAVVALAFNFVLVLSIMSINKAAFTVPGIAGVVLTFGQAVDSNVLIYERMREEFLRGADMRTAVRLGFSRAFSPIMDGNISNLIICAVLYFFGTQEIKGFAITLGIGVLTTLFTSLVVSRLIFTILVEHVGWSKTSQLPMVFPALQRFLTPHIDWMKHRWTLLGLLAVFLVASAGVWVHLGAKLFDTEFSGGTQVELQFKTDENGKPLVTMTRQDVHDRLLDLARKAAPGDQVRVLLESEVLPVNPQPDGVTSNRFKIRFGNADQNILLTAITNQFAKEMESRTALSFNGQSAPDWRSAPVHAVLSRTLGENLNRPNLGDDVSGSLGGVAILIENISPATTRDSLISRLDEMRQHPEYADTLSRNRDLRVIEGDNSAVKTAVVLVRDDAVSAFGDPERWDREVATREWRLVNDALTRTSQLASVQSFSPAIARTFAAQAIVSTVLSLLLLTIYVWVRFGAARWAIAATLPLFADVIGIVGLIGLAQILYENPTTNPMARSLGLLPFKLDLAQIAAVLTIVGYSLNDKIIILDRIRENKGKAPFATYEVINDSINQTLSRTIITAGAHMITTIVLYIWGGEAVRGFAYTFNLGVILGTYTSIVSSPLVWSHTHEKQVPPGASPPKAPPPALASSGV